MQINSLEATEENIVKSLNEDSIGRNCDIDYFLKYLNGIEGYYSIALDAKWGDGKTFFVKQLKYIIDALNNREGTDIEKIKSLHKDGLKSLVQMSSSMTVYYDAWLNDNDDDPILSLVWTILHDNKAAIDRNRVKLGEVLGCVVNCISGRDFSSIRGSLEGYDLLKEIEEKKQLEDQIIAFFQTLNYEKANRIIIFIDELDRCRPNFTVKLLERIKHYICLDNIIVVYSVNIDQLQHTIRKEYGNDFDALSYLDKFFNVKIPLPNPDMNLFYKNIGVNENNIHYEVCKRVVDYYNLGMREIINYFSQVDMAIHGCAHAEYGLSPLEVILGLLLAPVLIGIYDFEREQYTIFMNGDDCKPYISILSSQFIAENIGFYLLSPDETFSEYDASPEVKLVKFADKLAKLQNDIITCSMDKRNYSKIGSVKIDNNTKYMLEGLVAGLTDIAEYSVKERE